MIFSIILCTLLQIANPPQFTTKEGLYEIDAKEVTQLPSFYDIHISPIKPQTSSKVNTWNGRVNVLESNKQVIIGTATNSSSAYYAPWDPHWPWWPWEPWKPPKPHETPIGEGLGFILFLVFTFSIYKNYDSRRINKRT